MAKMQRMLVLAVLTLVLLQSGCITVNLLEPPGPVQEVQLAGTGDSKVLLMDLSGVISSQEKEGLLPQPNMLANFKEELTKASKDDKVKAVVLRINSPGGTVNASDILYHELKTFKANKKIPVIASMMDVAASGGYYLAMATDAILVHPSTVTGSIGVIMLTVNARGLLEKVGVEANAITSGPRKDMGSPFRTMTTEEKAIFQSVIDSFYQRFLTVVQEGRPQLSADQIKKLADGRIYSGEQAKEAGLVDDIGYLDEAIERAKKNAGLTEARIVTYRRHGEYQNNIYSRVLSGGSGLSSLANMDLLSLVRGGSPAILVWGVRGAVGLYAVLGAGAVAGLLGTLSGCYRAPGTARDQLIFFSEEKELQFGLSAYREVLREARLSENPEINEQIQRVGRKIATVANKPEYQWEFAVIEDEKMVNAFCLPGGKVAVFTGILKHTKTDAGLATVMGHEIAHALQRHGVERMSRSIIDQIAQLGAIGAAASGHSSGGAIQGLLGAYGVNVSLPFNRKQESEADYIGLRLMSQAGYDPREAVPFWERMSGCPRQMIDKLCFRSQHAIPEFLSTHPSDVTRINQLETWMPEAMRYYQAAGGTPPPAPAPYKPAIGPLPQAS